MRRAVLRATGLAVAMIGFGVGVAGCGDEPAPVITQAEYDDHVTVVCHEHGRELIQASADVFTTTNSAAEEVAFFRSDWIPRVRAVVRLVADGGFPPEKDAEYREALTGVLTTVTEFEPNIERYIQLADLGPIPENERDYRNEILSGLEAADIRCIA